MRRRATLLACGLLAAIFVVIFCVMLFRAGEAPQMVHKSAEMLATFDAQEPPAPAMKAPAPPAELAGGDDAIPSTDAITVNVPQLAYSYVLGYRLPGSAIADAQSAHVALCRRLGSARCQLLSMQRSSNDDGNAHANLKLRVASAMAPAFSSELSKLIAKAGGRTSDAQVTAEDVSKQLVDTDARIRQREILVTRLTDMLRNRKGRVSELVEAERSVAQAQEELDQAKGWLTELRGRVAFSDFTINYVPVTETAPTPRNFVGQLQDAVVQSGGVVVAVVRALLMLTIFVLPWLMIAGPVALFFVAQRRRRTARLADA